MKAVGLGVGWVPERDQPCDLLMALSLVPRLFQVGRLSPALRNTMGVKWRGLCV